MQMIGSFNQYLTTSDSYKIKPTHSIKKSYGLAKNHKINIPLRPIVSSLNSITSGAESYLHNLISPIVKTCKYSVNSTIEFKKRFLKI